MADKPHRLSYSAGRGGECRGEAWQHGTLAEKPSAFLKKSSNETPALLHLFGRSLYIVKQRAWRFLDVACVPHVARVVMVSAEYQSTDTCKTYTSCWCVN